MKMLLMGDSRAVYHVASRACARGDDVRIVMRDRDKALDYGQRLDVVTLVAEPASLQVFSAHQDWWPDVFIAMEHEDHDNLAACIAARTMMGVPRCIALVNDPEHRDTFLDLGLQSVVSVAALLGAVIDQASTFDGVCSRLELGGVEMFEVRLPRASAWHGVALRALDLPPGALVVAVLRQGRSLVPRGHVTLARGDELILTCHRTLSQASLRALLAREAS